MENENKEIFDYDEYVKSGGKKNKTKKPVQKKGGLMKPKADPKQEKASETKKTESAKQEKPTEVKKPEPAKQEKPTEVKKPEPAKQDKPTEVKKPEPAKQEKPTEAKKPEPDKQEKPSEAKKPEPAKQEKLTKAKKSEPAKQEKPSEVKKSEPAKQDKTAEEKKTEPVNKEKSAEDKKTALKNAGKKIHSSGKKEDKLKIREESIDSIKKMFDGALDEDSEDMAELLSEEPAPEMPAAVPVDRSRMYFLLGLAVAFFSVIGIISTVFFSIGKIQEFTDNTQQKNDFARFIYPVVICDPAPFNETMRMNSDTILSAAMWDIILYEDKTKYVQDFDYITVPEVDVEKHAVKLFGDGLSFNHRSILNTEVKFHYEEDIRSYRIPAKPRYFTYSPYVEEIQREGDVYVLSVGYISPTPAYFDLNENSETPTPDKYVEYVVKKQGDEYTLTAINISEKGRDMNLGL